MKEQVRRRIDKIQQKDQVRNWPKVSSEYQLLCNQLWVEFRRFVGRETGREELQQTPDFLQETGPINPEWVRYKRSITEEIRTSSPGKLRYEAHKGWKAEDASSPIGRIERLQEEARAAIRENKTQQKKTESYLRRELQEIFNGYAGERFNGVRDVVNGHDFRGVNILYMAGRSLRYWREELVNTRNQSVEYVLFDRWKEAPKNIKTPSNVELFFKTVLTETQKTEKGSNALEIVKKLFALGPEGYLALARLFYNGDMLKTHLNLSAVAKMTGRRLPEGWQQFTGTVTEFRELERRIADFPPGVEGYLSAAEELYNGDMKKTYQNLSAVTKMTGGRLPEGWQQFRGTVTEFRELERGIADFPPGVEGYLSAAELYNGDMLKTYINFSAVTKMTGRRLPEGWRWQQFPGTVTEFKVQQIWIKDNPTGTLENFMRHCNIQNPKKAKMHLAAIRAMCGYV